jgi:hypothetical protein
MKKNIENSDMPISSPTMFDPRSVCSLKIENGTSGCALRRSITTKAASRPIAIAPSRIVSAEPQPAEFALTSA